MTQKPLETTTEGAHKNSTPLMHIQIRDKMFIKLPYHGASKDMYWPNSKKTDF